MSPLKTIKTFRDLLSFLTIIPMNTKEDFVLNTAQHIYLFPLIGALIGAFGAAYFVASSYIIDFLLSTANMLIVFPTAFLAKAAPAAMTIAFLLILTGLQHFDGLVDLGNTLGFRNVQDRKMIAHKWTVTYSGALFALIVEFLAVIGLFLINPWIAIGAVIASEVAAKLAMVTIVWGGKPSHKGLGSIFLRMAKKKLNIAAYVAAVLIVFPILFFLGSPLSGIIGVVAVLASVPVGLLMVKVSEKTFGGVSGDTIGATNEIARALCLVLMAVLLGVLA
ncbi:MAG: adenosylcobinamide-GDP ribazoletransferase [Candidatus Bathyarchaeota archaeon]|nr:adenosylcobinamide-GDP ribazoletransferase [Candidatus Bathyarchaeota archaeon]